MSARLVMIGAGGHAQVLAEAVRAAGRTLAGYVDRAAGAAPSGWILLGGDEDVLALDPGEVELINGIGGIGDTAPRCAVFERFRTRGFRFATVVHPSAIVAGDVRLDEGAQVMAGAVLQVGVTVGANAIINTGAVLDHHCHIGAHAHVAPGAVLSGAVTVGDGAHVGVGATIIQGIAVGDGALIGAGAVVAAPVAPATRVLGIPARPVKPRESGGSA